MALGLRDLTAEGVTAELAEFDKLGRDAFLSEHGFGEAKDYFVRWQGRLYDSKAIAGAAIGRRGADFSGGDATVAKRLRELGFVVTQPFDWTRDEVVLVCDLVVRKGWRTSAKEGEEVRELSDLLRRAGIHHSELQSPRHRNPAGVEMKTGNLVSLSPGYPGKLTNVGKWDREVVAEFVADPERMHREAASIREAIETLATRIAVSHRRAGEPDPNDLEPGLAVEGGVRERLHRVRERDKKLRGEKIRRSRETTGRLACEACGFDFALQYGDERARDFIEVHHTVPLHETGPRKTRVEDLALLCSNCHRMVHVRPPALSLDELRGLLQRRG